MKFHAVLLLLASAALVSAAVFEQVVCDDNLCRDNCVKTQFNQHQCYMTTAQDSVINWCASGDLVQKIYPFAQNCSFYNYEQRVPVDTCNAGSQNFVEYVCARSESDSTPRLLRVGPRPIVGTEIRSVAPVVVPTQGNLIDTNSLKFTQVWQSGVLQIVAESPRVALLATSWVSAKTAALTVVADGKPLGNVNVCDALLTCATDASHFPIPALRTPFAGISASSSSRVLSLNLGAARGLAKSTLSIKANLEGKMVTVVDLKM